MKYEIFISYRRDGGDTLAQLIYDRLTARGYKVFLDIESLRSGKFNEKLLNVIEECKDLIVILPPGALERCSNEGDWLYLELSYAMKNRKNIIPVMMKGFEWPETFPEGLEGLCVVAAMFAVFFAWAAVRWVRGGREGGQPSENSFYLSRRTRR